MKRTLQLSIALALVAGGTATAPAANVTFGTGLNQFTMEFVEIGNASNPADTTGVPDPAGSVSYIYEIGKFEVSEDMIDKANAEGGLGITKNTRGPDKPATAISWIEAATFVNWLNTSQGFQAAYHFDAVGDFQLWSAAEAWQLDGQNLYRHKDAQYFLPNADEWYKAAFYDPVAGTYYDFQTGSDTQPAAVASGTAPGTAVFAFAGSGPADVTLAGGLSPYGTMGQGGNVAEWEESAFDLVNDTGLEQRGNRGGGWRSSGNTLRASDRRAANATASSDALGFRVATVVIPEPSRAVLVVLGLGAFVVTRRRR